MCSVKLWWKRVLRLLLDCQRRSEREDRSTWAQGVREGHPRGRGLGQPCKASAKKARSQDSEPGGRVAVATEVARLVRAPGVQRGLALDLSGQTGKLMVFA